MTHTFQTTIDGQKVTGYASYIDANKPTPTVKGTNIGPEFFDKAGIDPASVVEAKIEVNRGYDHGKPATISVNGQKVDDVPAALIAAGAKPAPVVA